MRRSRTALQFSELRAREFILWVHLQRALKRLVPGPWFNVTGGMSAWVKAGYGVRRSAPPSQT